MIVSVVRIFLIRQKRHLRQIQLYENQALLAEIETDRFCSNGFQDTSITRMQTQKIHTSNISKTDDNLLAI